MQSGVTRVPFRSSAIYASPTTAATTVVAIDAIPSSISSRLALMAQAFKKWRWAGPLRITAEVDYQPVSSSAAVPFGIMTAISYYGGPSTSVGAAVNSVSDLVEMVHSARGMRRATITVPLFALKEGQLAPWMLTSIGTLTSATEDEIGGCIFAAFNIQGTTANAARCWIHVDGIMEFSDPTEPSVTSTSDEKIPSSVKVTLHPENSHSEHDDDDAKSHVWINDPERPLNALPPPAPSRRVSATPHPVRRTG